MSLDGTYTGLQASIADWIARSDMTTQIPDFIKQFEAVSNRRLRVRQMETTTALTTTSGTASLPSDYLAWRRAYFTTNGANTELEYVHPSYLNALYPSGAAGYPKAFTIYGSNFRALPFNDTAAAFTLDYYQVIPPLATNSASWLLTAHPDLYLYGALTEAYKYIKNFDSALTHSQMRDGLIEEVLRLDAQSRGPAAVRVMGSTP